MGIKMPLAWYQMMREKVRFLLAIAGIAFANVLIFTQLGFLDALFDGAVRPHNSLVADVVLTNPRQPTFFSPQSFSRRRLYQVLKYPEVSSTSGVMMHSMLWRNPVTQKTRAIQVFGIDPGRLSFSFPELQSNQGKLKLSDRVLFDGRSRPEYGPIVDMLEKNPELWVELNDRHVKVVGTFSLGASFSADGNVITSESTFRRLFPNLPDNQIHVGLIRLKEGVDTERFAERLRTDFGHDVAVNTKQQLAQLEKGYWAKSTGVGFVFGLGVCVGFIVGLVIVYQILHADVADHLAEYATLKAMGYTDGYLARVLIEEALILACLGFIPGYLLSVAVYSIAMHATLIPLSMTLVRTSQVFLLTVLMCLASALVASKKLRQADPAEIF